jgi:hypothetical protein
MALEAAHGGRVRIAVLHVPEPILSYLGLCAKRAKFHAVKIAPKPFGFNAGGIAPIALQVSAEHPELGLPIEDK